MIRKTLKILFMSAIALSVVLVGACGKEKKRTQVQRRGKAQNTAGKASVETCQKETPKKILSLDGNKCIAPADCKESDNMQEQNGQCLCNDGYQADIQDEKNVSCVKIEKAESTGPSSPAEDSPKTDGSTTSGDGATTTDESTTAGNESPLPSFKSGEGMVNIQCGAQARIESLNLTVKSSAGSDLTLKYTMGTSDWFTESQAKALMPTQDSPAEAKLAKIEATCLIGCGAVKFSVSPAAADVAGADSLKGVFYGVPKTSCVDDKDTADARPMTLTGSKPEKIN